MLDYSLPDGWRRSRFRDVYDPAQLYRAALLLYTKSLFQRAKARSRAWDGGNLYDFARQGGRRLEILHGQLERREFRFGPATAQSINRRGRDRTVYLWPWAERVVDTMLFHLLNRHCDGLFGGHVYAYRWRGFGVDRCQRRTARFLAAGPGPVFVVKRDVANYFPSIDHDVLLEALAAWVEPTDYLYELLAQRVRFRVRDDAGAVTPVACGVPFGAPTACFLANLYLVPLDRALAALPDTHYCRYADDLLVATRDRDVAAEAIAVVDRSLAALRLASKPDHELNLALGGDGPAPFTPAAHVRHLGLEFRADGTIGLSRDKFRKLRNQFRYAFRRARGKWRPLPNPEARARCLCAVAAHLLDDQARPVAIIDYYLKHVTDDAQLRLLDRWLAEEVLALAFGTGHRKGNFRRLPFSRLREFGLPSLRHRRQLLQHGHLESTFLRWQRPASAGAKRQRRPSRTDGISSSSGSTGINECP